MFPATGPISEISEAPDVICATTWQLASETIKVDTYSSVQLVTSQRSAMIKEIQLIFLTKQPPLGGKGYISLCRTEKKNTELAPKKWWNSKTSQGTGHGSPCPKVSQLSQKATFGGKRVAKSHLCREIVRLSQGFLRQRSAGCPQHLFSLQKHLLILLLHLVAQVLSSSGKKETIKDM